MASNVCCFAPLRGTACLHVLIHSGDVRADRSHSGSPSPCALFPIPAVVLCLSFSVFPLSLSLPARASWLSRLGWQTSHSADHMEIYLHTEFKLKHIFYPDSLIFFFLICCSPVKPPRPPPPSPYALVNKLVYNKNTNRTCRREAPLSLSLPLSYPECSVLLLRRETGAVQVTVKCLKSPLFKPAETESEPRPCVQRPRTAC